MEIGLPLLRPAGDPAVKARVRGVLQREEACCCGVVMVEVLRGAKREKDFHLLEESLIAAAAHNRAVVLHRDGDFRRIAEAGALKEEMI